MNLSFKLIVLFALTLIIYGFSDVMTVYDNGFQNGTEDIHMLERGKMMYDRPASIFEPDETGRNNIAAYLLLGGLYKIYGYRAFYYYAALLGLHLLVVLFLASLARRIFDSLWGAAAAGIFFLVLSIHFQTIGWIENLGRVSMTLCCLWALILFHDSRTRCRPEKLFFVYFLWFAGLNFAEEGFVFPFLLIIYDVLILKINLLSKQHFPKLLAYIPFFLTQGIFFLLQYLLYGPAMRQYITLETHWPAKILGIVWSLINLWVPRREAVSFMTGIPLVRVIIPIFVLAPLSYFIVRFHAALFKRPFFLLFCILWFAITFFPYIFRPMEISWKEYPQPRYLYWPMMGISFLIGWFFDAFVKQVKDLHNKTLRRAAYGVLAVTSIYFYGLNLWTYCFMADKLCAAGCL